MTKHDLNDDQLDQLFEAARHSGAGPSDDFMQQLTRDAVDALGMQAAPTPTQPWFERFRQVVGGWGGIGGLALATVAGFWIGVSPPESLSAATNILALFDNSAAEVSELLGEWSQTELFLMEDG